MILRQTNKNLMVCQRILSRFGSLSKKHESFFKEAHRSGFLLCMINRLF
jgi:hypothetical protein